MATSLTLVGRLTKDIEIKKSKNNKEYGLIHLAAKRDYKDSNGKYITDFFTIPLWGKRAVSIRKFTHKGALVAVYGKLETNKNVQDSLDKNYINIVANSVELLSSHKEKSEDDIDTAENEKENTREQSKEFTNEISNVNFGEDQDVDKWY